jgi:hypothetical protein
MTLSEDTRTICKENWDETDHGCARCPLRKACIRSHPPTLEGLNQHRASVNQLAAQILRDRSPSEFLSAKAEIETKARERI